MQTKGIVNTRGFTFFVKIGNDIQFKGSQTGAPREQAHLRNQKKNRKSPGKWTSLNLAFYNAPNWLKTGLEITWILLDFTISTTISSRDPFVEWVVNIIQHFSPNTTTHKKITELLPKQFRFGNSSTDITKLNAQNNSVRASVIHWSHFLLRPSNSGNISVR